MVCVVKIQTTLKRHVCQDTPTTTPTFSIKAKNIQTWWYSPCLSRQTLPHHQRTWLGSWVPQGVRPTSQQYPQSELPVLWLQLWAAVSTMEALNIAHSDWCSNLLQDELEVPSKVADDDVTDSSLSQVFQGHTSYMFVFTMPVWQPSPSSDPIQPHVLISWHLCSECPRHTTADQMMPSGWSSVFKPRVF